MRKIGNTNSNAQFNPKNTRPPMPLDADEIDSAMERFIRQKYESKSLSEGAPVRSPAVITHTGGTAGTASSDDHPPPPPPKPGRRFGFGLRSASSAFPLGRSRESSEGVRKGANVPPLQVEKPSRIIGASIGVTEGREGLEWKLIQLREMGFQDNQKNTNILQGLNGDLERTIESLVKLGEGSSKGTARTPLSSRIPSRQHTPNPPFSAGARIVSPQSTPSQSSQLSPPPSARSNNPFDLPSTAPGPQQPFESAFSNLNISSMQSQQTSPNLFPNATGGYQSNQMQTIPVNFHQSMTPPIPQVPEQYPTYHNNARQQPQNPFLFSPQQQNLPSAISPNVYSTQQSGASTQNPFLNQQSLDNALFSPSQASSVQQQQAIPQQLPQQHPQQQAPQYGSVQTPQFTMQQEQHFLQSPTQLANSQAFVAQPSIYAQPSPFGPLSPLSLQSPHQQQMQPLNAQPTGRLDKTSIMALYNYPQLAPLPTTPNSNSSAQNSTVPSPQVQAAQLPPGFGRSPQRSVTMPVSTSGSKNPFLSAGAPQSPPAVRPPGPWSHASRESSDSGRHSPDAFASLSARFVR